MSKDIRLKKGLNIHLDGEADKVYASIPQSETFVIRPPDFHGMTPKMSVKEGDRVSRLCTFFDKYNDRINFTSPTSGQVVSINRRCQTKNSGSCSKVRY